MTVKNYVVTSHRRIKSTKWVWKDTKDEGDIYTLYDNMRKESLASLNAFLEGEWEYVLFDEDIEHISQAMPLNNDRVYDMWHAEPCNILWVGPDVQATRPVNFFGEFDEFRLFNWTDPKHWHEPNQYNLRFENLFNNDLQYYPHTMNPTLWEMERKMRSEWDVSDSANSYNNQQLIHNAMFWSQGLDWADAHRPDLFYQAQWIPWYDLPVQDAWNGSKFEDAVMIHWHSSRHAPTKLECMRQINQQTGVSSEGL